jgi:hypothetical protein
VPPWPPPDTPGFPPRIRRLTLGQALRILGLELYRIIKDHLRKRRRQP